MPSEASHIALAVRTGHTLDTLTGDPALHAEWIATTAFYRALHIVEAVFANDADIRHGRDHGSRAAVLKQTRYANIWKHYRPLWNASMVARYLHNRHGRGTYGCFTDFLPANQVIPELVNHRLRQVEKSAAKLLSDPVRQTLAGHRPATPTKRRKSDGPQQR